MSLQPIECKYVTEDLVREWKNASATANLKPSGPVPMLRFLYELCWNMVRGELPFQKCKVILDSVSFSDNQSKEDLDSVLADIVSQMGQDHTMPGDCRARLAKMAKWFVESTLVPLRLFQERCEEEFLWESEMIKIKAQDLKLKEVRANTRLLYQQTKFNLLREESEGYAKLVTLLCQSGLEASTQNTSTTIISTIKSLIGHFDLDPNRVFDIVLECFELLPENSIFYELIPIFPKSHASQILGFKFQYYQRMEVNTPVPFGLFRLTALLVKTNFIDLDSIYVHLLPKDEEAFEHYSAFSAQRFDEANKIGKINLAATGKDLMEDEKQADVTVDLYAAVDMEREAVSERSTEVESNQSLGLLRGFLSVDDWYHAQILFDRLSPLDPVAHIQICDGLFSLIEKTISFAYAVVCRTIIQGSGSLIGSSSDATESVATSSSQSSFVDLPRELFQMLTSSGPYMYRDPILLQKVCRVLRGYYLSALPESGDVVRLDSRPRLKEVKLRIEEALGTCILPSLQLIPANPAVGQEIWELMSLLPYEVRYRLYGEWEKDDEHIPMVLAARQIAKLDTRRILKRLAKENLKQLGRMVAKLAHANPMTVLRTIVHQIEAYKDMITPVVDAFKYLTQLEYDVLEYVVIERLAQSGREKLKDNGLNLSDWLQSLASFWGHLCKKYPSMELRGLFQYLVNQLKRGTGIELVLLQELIQQMANVQHTENMTEEQLDSMAGSDTLRCQASSFGITRNNKALTKSMNRLRDSLFPKDEPKLAIPLLLLIAQHRSMVVINADAPHIKMVSEQFDRCHGALLQYVDFLISALTPATAYAQLIPTLDDLVHKYHLEPEVAFLIYRPVMRLFKCFNEVEVFWPSSVTDEGDVSNTDKESESSMSTTKVALDLGNAHKPITWPDLLYTVRSMLPMKVWNSLSPDLYVTFWGLTLYDLYVPRSRYDSEIAKQHSALKALEEVPDNSNSAITKRKKDKERIQELLDRLTNELLKHEQHVASVRRRLSHEKDKWLSSSSDTLINTEFLQRCIFPRCIFSMPDAVYCSMFVHTLHSLGTPYFNTINHLDILICKTLHPMICCCTEFEVGRLGRFLYETLKIAYHWKSDESIYEQECGSMPGFSVPNKNRQQRFTYKQFVRVHFKWSGKITRLLVHCLESAEYMDIRNALILLTKISSIFPVTRRSGINIEKRVVKIKGDDREDLKVLATGVTAALAARKSSWISEEEFHMGLVEMKPAASPAKSLANLANGSSQTLPQNETIGTRSAASGHHKLRATSSTGTDGQAVLPSSTVQHGSLRSSGIQKATDEVRKVSPEENIAKVSLKSFAESESRPPLKRAAQAAGTKQAKQDALKDDNRSGKSVGRTSGQIASISIDKDVQSHLPEGRQSGHGGTAAIVTSNGGTISASVKVSGSARVSTDLHSSLPKIDGGAIKSTESRVSVGKHNDDLEATEMLQPISSRSIHSSDDTSTSLRLVDKQQRRTSPIEEHDRLNKRRKGDSETKDGEGLEVRLSDRDRSGDRQTDKALPMEPEKTGDDERALVKPTDKLLERAKDKVGDRYERDHRERFDRSDKSRAEEIFSEKSRDRSMERHARERSSERVQERGTERSFDRLADKNKDERSKPRHSEISNDKSHLDDRFHGQSLPPPPPLPPNIVPQSVGVSRRDEEADRRAGSSTRHMQRLSPRHDEKERRRSEENVLSSQDDAKRRREEDLRERKRDERDGGTMKVEDRDREKGTIVKDDMDPAAATKRRKIKRDHLSSEASGEYPPVAPPPSLSMGTSSQSFDGRERGDRKGVSTQQRAAYMEETVPRSHSKEATSKVTRRDNETMYERDWEEEKRLRAEPKRKHRK